MSWNNIKLILLREVRDQLRDRRTLFMVAVVPLLLYPAMGIGMLQMTMLFTEQPRTVVILGAEHLPPPQLLDGNSFVSNWFRIPDDADKLAVITEADLKKPNQDEPDAQAVNLIEQAKVIRNKLSKRAEIEADIEAAEQENDEDKAKSLQTKLDQIEHELIQLFASSQMQVLIIVPDGFAEHVEKVNRQLAERTAAAHEIFDYPRPIIVKNRADDKSMVAYNRVKEAMDAWEQEILKQRLNLAQLPESLPKPVNLDSVDLAGQDQLAANLWSKLFPALLVIMAVTGAFYPAVDLAAGEKERGTMETLLICPATRSEIVMGKFFTVMLFSASTALLNLASMGATGRYMLSVAGRGAFSKIGDIAFPSLGSLIWVVVLLVPLAALFSALSLALATFARSSKEGQYYLTPLLMVTMGLTVFCLSPAVEITPFYSIMPIVGVALLLKALLLAPVHTSALYMYMIPVLVTSVGYSLLALWWAIELFKREEVLFREAERFELRLWIRHLLRDKEPTPSFSEAGFCFVIIMLLQFASLKFMGQAVEQATLAKTSEDAIGVLMMKLLMIQQLVIIFSPALFMGVILTTSVVRTFRLRPPKFGMLAVAILLPVALHPLSLEFMSHLGWFFPKLPQSAVKALHTMADTQQPWWFVLLAFAVAPAICEETAFRGFILSGFNRSGRVWLAIVLSSLTFGVMHMIPQQVFNATLLGLVLALIAIRSNSLLPGIVFHFIYNSLAVLHSRIGASWVKTMPANRFISVEDEMLRYQWPTLVICAGVAIVLLHWLARQSNAEATFPAPQVFSPEPERLAETGVAAKPPVGIR